MVQPSDEPLRLSVLDQSPIPEGSTGGDALRNSIDLAQHTEELGYYRYWVAEHHGTPGLACNSPEVLIGLIAAATNRLRVGSGGVMLPHYSPLKVAESFSMLAGLFPGRIDLGIGRAAGTDSATSFALQRDRRHRSPDDFTQQLTELLGYIENRPSAGPLSSRIVLPGRPEAPEPWLLGSSAQSAIWAAEMGLPYVFADFINPAGAAIAQHYRDAFVPSDRLKAPRIAVAAWTICADTDAEAEFLSSSFRMMMLLMRRGQLISVPTPETAKEFLDEPAIRGDLLQMQRRLIVGSPTTVQTGIHALADEYNASEILLVNILHSYSARRRSYELIADVMGLSPHLTPATCAD